MDGDKFIREVFLESMNLRIGEISRDIPATGLIPLEERLVESMIDELSALNKEGDNTESIALAALDLRRLREDPNVAPKIKKLIDEKAYDAELIKNAIIDMHDKNYAKNVSLREYLTLMQNKSIHQIFFSAKKEDRTINHLGHEAGLGLNHRYALERGEKLTLQLHFLKYHWERAYDRVHPYISMVIEEQDPKLKPSRIFIDNLHHINEKFPYPQRGEEPYRSHITFRIGAAITRYIPNIDWYNVYFREGMFSTEMWTLFMSILGKESLIEKKIKLFNTYGEKNLRKIVQKFEAPVGEFTLEASTERGDITSPDYGGKPNINFHYKEYPGTSSIVELSFERVHMYEKNSKNPFNTDKYAF